MTDDELFYSIIVIQGKYYYLAQKYLFTLFAYIDIYLLALIRVPKSQKLPNIKSKSKLRIEESKISTPKIAH